MAIRKVECIARRDFCWWMMERMPRLYVADDATYQGSIIVADYQRAEFDIINFKLSHGLRTVAVRPDLAQRVAEARKGGTGISTFHWLIGNHPGADQARFAYAQLQRLGLDGSAGHVVDIEEQPDADDELPPGWDQIRDYCTTMQKLLRRPIMAYTGRWWWQQAGRRWDGSSLTPYLMAAPNDGYPGSYPGDTSTLWRAGYGGWPNLACMQYAVQPLIFPGGERGTINVSKSVIRDPAVWKALTTPAAVS